MEGSRQGVHLPAHALIRQTPAPVVPHVLSLFLPPRYVQGWFPPERFPFSFSPKAQGYDIQAWRTPSGSPTGPNWSTSISMKTRKWQSQGIFRELRTKYGLDEKSVPSYPAAPTNIENLISNRKTQYKTYFRRWGLRKKSLSDSVGGQVHRATNQQEKEGRERSVCRRGSIPPTPQQAEEVRYDQMFVSTVDDLSGGPLSVFPYLPTYMDPRQLRRS